VRPRAHLPSLGPPGADFCLRPIRTPAEDGRIRHEPADRAGPSSPAPSPAGPGTSGAPLGIGGGAIPGRQAGGRPRGAGVDPPDAMGAGSVPPARGTGGPRATIAPPPGRDPRPHRPPPEHPVMGEGDLRGPLRGPSSVPGLGGEPPRHREGSLAAPVRGGGATALALPRPASPTGRAASGSRTGPGAPGGVQRPPPGGGPTAAGERRPLRRRVDPGAREGPGRRQMADDPDAPGGADRAGAAHAGAPGRREAVRGVAFGGGPVAPAGGPARGPRAARGPSLPPRPAEDLRSPGALRGDGPRPAEEPPWTRVGGHDGPLCGPRLRRDAGGAPAVRGRDRGAAVGPSPAGDASGAAMARRWCRAR